MFYVTIIHPHSIEKLAHTFLWCIDNLNGYSYIRYMKNTPYGAKIKTSTRIRRDMTNDLGTKMRVYLCAVNEIYLSFGFRDEGDAMMFAIRYGSEPEEKNLIFNRDIVNGLPLSLTNLYKYLRDGVPSTEFID